VKQQQQQISRRKFLKKSTVLFGMGALMHSLVKLPIPFFEDLFFDMKLKLLNKIDLYWNRYLKRLTKNQ